MKKVLFSLIAVAFATLTIVSCGSKSDPKDVAMNYLNALKKADYETAKKYSTKETVSMLEMISSFSGMVPDSIKNQAKDIKIDIKDVKEEGDKCVVTFESSDKKGSEEKLNLVKTDGKWLVNMSKDDMGGADAPMEDGSVPPAEGTGNDSLSVAKPE